MVHEVTELNMTERLRHMSLFLLVKHVKIVSALGHLHFPYVSRLEDSSS